MRRWRLSRGDIALYVALVSVILPTGIFLTRHLTPPGIHVWGNVVMALVVGGLICRYFGFLIPAKLTYGGPANRVLFGWVLPFACAQWSFAMWHPGFKYYLGPGAAAGFTAATAFRLVRRWQAMHAMSKDERDASLPHSNSSLVFQIIELGGSVFFATLVLIIGAQLTTALKPVLERAAEPLPGGHLTVGGHPVVAYVAVSLCGLVFTVAVTSRFLGSIAIGLRDFEIPRAGQYFWACLPYVIALGWSAWQSGLAFGCASTLLLLIALGIWTDSPPEVAFSKAKAATVLWRSQLLQRLWSRSRTEPT